MKIHICKYCGAEFTSKQKLGGHVTYCKLNPNAEKNLKNIVNARQHIKNKGFKNGSYPHLHCQYCGREIIGKGPLSYHEHRCQSNPDYIPTERQKRLNERKNKPRKLSESHKQKIRESLIKWKCEHPEQYLNYCRGKSKCCELFKEYLRKNNINFIEEDIPYPKERLYSLDISFPDEKIGIEINGTQHYDNEGNLNKSSLEKQRFFEEHGWKIIQIYYKWCYGVMDDNKEIQSIFDLPIHNKEYVKTCFGRKYRFEELKLEKFKFKAKLENIDLSNVNNINDAKRIYKYEKAKQHYNTYVLPRRNEIIRCCETSNIDFKKFGWSEKAKQWLKDNSLFSFENILHAFIKYYPEFIELYRPFIRKGTKYKFNAPLAE